MKTRDLQYYVNCFNNLSVNRKDGSPAPHKPLLLLSIIDLVEQGFIVEPRVELTDLLIATFERNKNLFVSSNSKFTPIIGTPFYHLRSEPFWSLIPFDEKEQPETSAITTIRKHYKYARIDRELFLLLKDPISRQRLRATLKSCYLSNQHHDRMSPLVTIIVAALSLIA